MGKFIDISGQRFGFWVVQKRTDNTKNGQVQWRCKCECGKEKNITTNSLRSGNSTSCGCNHAPDLVGAKFGQLTVIKLNDTPNKLFKRTWQCSCVCGNTIITDTNKLKNKLITSCGCIIRKGANKKIQGIKNLIKENEEIIKINQKNDNAQIIEHKTGFDMIRMKKEDLISILLEINDGLRHDLYLLEQRNKIRWNSTIK